VSTRNEPRTRRAGANWRSDPAEEVALVARAKRDLLLRAHRFRLRHEDLEDCFSQAVFELVKYARGGGRFSSREHLANAIEQRFLSRIHDRRRALSGRSPMQAALESATWLGGGEDEQITVADARADLERLVVLREELQRIAAVARELSYEQRLVIASQVALQMSCGEFCARHEWTAEKYRKVAQRARARLRRLMELDEDHAGVPNTAVESEQNTGTNL
jgi:DNA-directed RNA polymerase specialized sigma24 family protein